MLFNIIQTSQSILTFEHYVLQEIEQDQLPSSPHAPSQSVFLLPTHLE